MEQSETLKYLYLLFSDPDTLPFDRECYKTISSVEGVLIDLLLMLVASFRRLRVQH